MATREYTEHQLSRPETEGHSSSNLEKYLSPSAIPEVRAALRRESLQHNLISYQAQLCNIWTHPRTNYQKFNMLRADDRMLGLNDHSEKERTSFREEYRFLNKATVFYWTESAQALRGTILLGGIWHTWFSATGQKPDFLLDHFFATPVFVNKSIAGTIPQIVRAHKAVYSQLQAGAQNRLRDGHPGLKFKSDPRHFKIEPLLGALIAVFDEYKKITVDRREDGTRHCEDLAERQSILLVRTGCEDGLSAPISFDSVKPYTPPLSRNGDTENIDVVRLPLLVGVRFVADLLLREGKGANSNSDSDTCSGPDLLPGAKEWHFRNWEQFSMIEIKNLGLADAKAEDIKKKLKLTPEDLSNEENAPMHFDMGWY